MIYNKFIMTQEQKELLLQDLCARLQYGVKVEIIYYDDIFELLAIYANGTTYATKYIIGYQPIETYFEDCKPYLFPMSSMTKEQKRDLLLTVVGKKGLELFSVTKDGIVSNDKEEQSIYSFSFNNINFSNKTTKAYIDWLNKNHFDYRGLIPMGLAIDATGKEIY